MMATSKFNVLEDLHGEKEHENLPLRLNGACWLTRWLTGYEAEMEGLHKRRRKEAIERSTVAEEERER